jgi:Ca2+-binding EF-hand superfamily protein
MLVGYPPFKARTDSGTLARVRAGAFSFERDGWSGVSAEAKDLITQMLTMDVSRRPGAADLLDHPWFDVADHAHAAHHAVGGEDYLARLSAYAHSSRMARLALKVIASSLRQNVSTGEEQRLRAAFGAADVDGDGKLTIKQLHAALKAVGVADEQAAADVDEFAAVCRADDHVAASGADVGTVDYDEFLAALFDADRVIHTRPDVLLAAFEKLDVDHDGYIGPEDLQRAMPGDASAEEAREAIRELLLEDDPEHVSEGKVSRAAFVASLMHHHAEYHPSETGGGGTATGPGGRGGTTTGGGGGSNTKEDTDGEGTGGGGTLAVPGGGGGPRRPSMDRRRRSIDRRRARVEQEPAASSGSPAPPPGLPRPPSVRKPGRVSTD